MNASFVFASCQSGAEALLKGEVARDHPQLRLAFSKPGFVTFKSPEPVGPRFALASVFARACGLSFGASKEIAATASELSRELGGSSLPRLAVFGRGGSCFADTPPATIASVARERRILLDTGLFRDGLPDDGDLVIDIAMHDEEEPWLGAHEHSALHSPFPGGVPPVTLPPDAPSRAYLKIEEAILRFGLDPRPQEHALELGCSPGGAAFALLSRGLTVVGVDPGQMDERVLENPAFSHRRIPAGALKRTDLPRPTEWLLMDMNLAPPVALRYFERAAGPLRATLRGCVATLKLNEARFADDIPSYVERIQSMGFTNVRAAQLPSHHREICVVGVGPRRERSARTARTR